MGSFISDMYDGRDMKNPLPTESTYKPSTELLLNSLKTISLPNSTEMKKDSLPDGPFLSYGLKLLHGWNLEWLLIKPEIYLSTDIIYLDLLSSLLLLLSLLLNLKANWKHNSTLGNKLLRDVDTVKKECIISCLEMEFNINYLFI